jgi:hypothetical protein
MADWSAAHVLRHAAFDAVLPKREIKLTGPLGGLTIRFSYDVVRLELPDT